MIQGIIIKQNKLKEIELKETIDQLHSLRYTIGKGTIMETIFQVKTNKAMKEMIINSSEQLKNYKIYIRRNYVIQKS